ncbi:MAG TPA: SRPBCC family protein [Microlunatus sp.]
MITYAFVDEWRIGSDVETVWTAFRRLEEWPEWWPSARSLTLVEPGSERGVGAVWRFVFQTRLPYRMRFDATFVGIEEFVVVEAEVAGRFEGAGRWVVTAIPGGTLLRFDWTVTPQIAWMQLVAPVARPVFGWNHRSLMVEGGAALARRLGVPLLAPSVSTLGTFSAASA